MKIREWIKSNLPHHQIYCEPFGGSFAVGFIMPTPNLTSYRLVLNDSDKHVWNLFRVLRDYRQEFLEKIAASPYSREDFDRSVEYIRSKRDFEKENPVDWARMYIIYNRQSMMGKEDGTWAIARQGENFCLTWASIPSLIREVADFFKNVFVERMDYKECIAKWDSPETLFYLDPPYEGVEKDFYEVNKKDGFDHKGMADLLKTIKGSFAVSYYDSKYIRDLYPVSEGFVIHEKSVLKHMQTTKKKDSVTELLIVRENSWAKQNSKERFCFE